MAHNVADSHPKSPSSRPFLVLVVGCQVSWLFACVSMLVLIGMDGYFLGWHVFVVVICVV